MMCSSSPQQEAKAAFGGKNVSGMSETVAHQVDDKLSDVVLQASSSRDPSSSALIAELVLFLGEFFFSIFAQWASCENTTNAFHFSRWSAAKASIRHASKVVTRH